MKKSAAKYQSAKKTRAFSASSSGTKKIKFIRATNANINKLKAGKVAVQK